MIRVLGVDPGTAVMGWGLIEGERDEIKALDFGALTPPRRALIGERLSFLYTELLKIIVGGRVQAVAVEQPFVAVNVRSALAIGRAQAIVLLAAARQGIPATEYTPAQIKRRVANYGASRKEQIQEMVRLQLGLAEIPEPDDAADALAVAICHIRELHFKEMVEGQTK